MTVVITGAAGFLGAALAERFAAGGEAVVALDRVAGPWAGDTGIATHTVDLGGGSPISELEDLVAGARVVVHLASVVSADAEADPARAWTVNVDGTRAVLLACATAARGCRFVLTSSVAVFGSAGAGEGAGRGMEVGDTTKQLPRSTYGMTKAMGEMLVNEATRRGEVDGRVARLPTVIIRPGRPNLAASSFASGMFREPLAGIDAVIPVPLPTPMVLIGRRTAVVGLQRLCEIDGAVLGSDRAVGFPALRLTVEEMQETLRSMAGWRGLRLGRLEVRPDPAVTAIVASWPGTWDDTRARDLGLPADGSLADIVADHLDTGTQARRRRG